MSKVACERAPEKRIFTKENNLSGKNPIPTNNKAQEVQNETIWETIAQLYHGCCAFTGMFQVGPLFLMH